jgi:hypothetical protein
VSSVTALPRPTCRPEQLDAESLEELVLVCLENLANLARARGHGGRAARLLDAAVLLREEQTSATF